LTTLHQSTPPVARGQSLRAHCCARTPFQRGSVAGVPKTCYVKGYYYSWFQLRHVTVVEDALRFHGSTYT
jgi:hypothetical protein